MAQIVGTPSDASVYSAHAFLYSGGSMQDLGTLPGGTTSYAYGINDNGQVVGYADVEYGDYGSGDHAFLYSDGVMQDLNNLIDPNSGWTLFDATGINDAGQIVGEGANSLGQNHAFLLTPVVPEPSTFVLLAAGAVGLLGYAWRRRKQTA